MPLALLQVEDNIFHQDHNEALLGLIRQNLSRYRVRPLLKSEYCQYSRDGFIACNWKGSTEGFCDGIRRV